MIQWILNLIFLLALISCTPTNQGLTDLVGGEANGKTVKVPGDLGNQAFLFTPISYDFGSIAVNSAPTTKTVIIRNISEYTVYLSGMSGPTGAFALDSDTCPRSPIPIDPNQSCTATVSFTPTSGGVLNSSLILTYGISHATNTTYTANMGLSGTGTGTLAFTGINSVSDIYSTQLKLNWTHVAGAVTYYVFKVNANGSTTIVANVTPPTSSYIVPGLSASTSYRYWVRVTDNVGAFDSNVNVVTTSTNTTPPAPVIIGQANYTFASANAITLGSTLSIDFNDFRTGVSTDTAITYSCGYDQVVNNSVTASGNCGSLPGAYSLNTATGAFSFTPTSQSSIGFYEIKMLATDNNSALTSAGIFTVDVKPAYTTTNLIGNYSANFANAVYNESSGTTWQDLTAFNNDGTLTNFSFGGSTGWLGAGTVASPYRLGLDGTNDYVDLSTMGNTATSLTLETWAQPTQISTTPVGIIMSNSDSSTHGLMLREAKGYRNRVEVVVGDKSYADEVLLDSPYVYLRMGEKSGEAIYDIGSAASTWTITSLSGYEQASGLNGNDKSLKFNGSSNRIISNSQFNSNGWSGVSYEAWVNYSAIQYDTIFCHAVQNYAAGYFWLYHNGVNGLTFQSANGVGSNLHNYVWTPTLGTWYHIAVTVDFTSHDYKLYINGVNVLTVAAVPTIITNLTNTPKINLGSYYTNTEGWHNGYMDEFAAYDHVLTPARVAAHYNSRNSLFSCLSNSLTESKWNHLAATFSNAAQSLKLYTNSNNDCATTTTGISLSGTSAQMSIGAKVPAVNSPTAGTYFKGEITDARVYSTALASTEVAINMAAQLEQFDIPNQIAGLNLWLKADAITGKSNGDIVTNWSDSSTAARSATAVATKEPLYITNAINGKPALRFDGINDQMDISGTQNSWTVFIVAKQRATKAGSMMHIVTGLGGTFLAYLTSIPANNTHVQWYMDPPNWATYSTVKSNLGTTSAHYHTYRGTTTLAEAWVDGTQGISNAGTYGAGYLKCLANYSCTDTRWFDGDIAEVIGYSGTLTDAERLRVEGYLKAKYGL